MEPEEAEKIAKFEKWQREVMIVGKKEVQEKTIEMSYWQDRALTAEHHNAILQQRVTRLLTALNMIFVSGSPDDAAWQIVLNALRSDTNG